MVPPDVVLGSVTINTATGAAVDNAGTCSAPGQTQTSNVHSFDAFLFIRQPVLRWQGTHIWKANWLGPDGKLIYATGAQSVTDARADLCWSLYLSGEPTLGTPGSWTVQTYLDSRPDATASYTVTDNQPALTGSVSVTDVSLWREPDVAPPQTVANCSFQGELQSTDVLTTDKAQLNKIAVSAWSGAHTLWGEWYQPDGTLWDWIPLNGTDAGVSNWCLYEYIAGYGAAKLPGNWHFMLYVDQAMQGTYPFTIRAPALRSAIQNRSTDTLHDTWRLSGAARGL